MWESATGRIFSLTGHLPDWASPSLGSLACLDRGLRIGTWLGALPSEAGDLPETYQSLVIGPCPRPTGNWRCKAMF